jgi:ethanolamine ammonia-lyase small subunit
MISRARRPVPRPSAIVGPLSLFWLRVRLEDRVQKLIGARVLEFALLVYDHPHLSRPDSMRLSGSRKLSRIGFNEKKSMRAGIA